MQAKEIMTAAPHSCGRTTNLSAVAELMLDGDCGMLPVLDNGTLVGVVTDRDLFIALGTRNARAFELTVGDVMQGPVTTCGPDDTVHDVLQLMKNRRIRRIPVEGFGGTVLGVISMNDVVLAAGARKGVRDSEVADALRGICAHHHPAPHIAAA